uniref:RING finger protein 11 n=1 Tax=Equus caballus TaxID=9796 RepID=A0A9L0SWK7_HORSE
MTSPSFTSLSPTGLVLARGRSRIRSRRRHIRPPNTPACSHLSAFAPVAPSAWSPSPKVGQEQVPVPVYHPTPSQTRLATQLTEEEQIRIAQRIGLIQHLPKGVYDPGRDGSEKKIRECVICMMDFVYGDPIRFLPCMHIYHLDCIDDWLMRSFTCPSCMEPVDAALLSSYETN